MTDDEKLEEVTTVFIRSLIKNKFEDPRKYLQLKKRISVLIKKEIHWKFTHEEIKTLMTAWGPALN
ncbi:hypothetical protein KW791_00390 [Candidatus Parcubacteria bacterium]|nr:hypothetical protein [Candidatus Parcubacteria bacterium]